MEEFVLHMNVSQSRIFNRLVVKTFISELTQLDKSKLWAYPRGGYLFTSDIQSVFMFREEISIVIRYLKACFLQ